MSWLEGCGGSNCMMIRVEVRMRPNQEAAKGSAAAFTVHGGWHGPHEIKCEMMTLLPARFGRAARCWAACVARCLCVVCPVSLPFFVNSSPPCDPICCDITAPHKHDDCPSVLDAVQAACASCG